MIPKKLTHRSSTSTNELSDRQQRIYNFLQANSIGVLSTVSPNSEPHGSVIYYSIDEHFIVHFLTKAKTRKFDNLAHNNHIMLTVFEPHSQTTAQVIGRAVEVTDSSKVNGIAGSVLGASLKTTTSGLLPITKLDAGTYSAFKVEPVQIRMAVYATSEQGDYEGIFESLESFELNNPVG
jgi:uncharacterized protein YhbP (UPF0306 family)